MSAWTFAEFEVLFFEILYLPFTRNRIASLYFGWDVRTRLGVAISKLFGLPVFHIKVDASLSQGHNKRTCRIVLHNLPLMSSAKQGSCGYHFLKSLGVTRQGD